MGTMETHRDTDSPAPPTPNWFCHCGTSFTTAGSLLSHAMTCAKVLADEDHS